MKTFWTLLLLGVLFMTSCGTGDSDNTLPQWNTEIDGTWIAQVRATSTTPAFEIVFLVERNNSDGGYYIVETNLTGLLNPQIQVNSRGEFAFKFYETTRITTLRGRFSTSGTSMNGEYMIEDFIFGLRRGNFTAYRKQ